MHLHYIPVDSAVPTIGSFSRLSTNKPWHSCLKQMMDSCPNLPHGTWYARPMSIKHWLYHWQYVLIGLYKAWRRKWFLRLSDKKRRNMVRWSAVVAREVCSLFGSNPQWTAPKPIAQSRLSCTQSQAPKGGLVTVSLLSKLSDSLWALPSASL